MLFSPKPGCMHLVKDSWFGVKDWSIIWFIFLDSIYETGVFAMVANCGRDNVISELKNICINKLSNFLILKNENWIKVENWKQKMKEDFHTKRRINSQSLTAATSLHVQQLQRCNSVSLERLWFPKLVKHRLCGNDKLPGLPLTLQKKASRLYHVCSI